MGEGGDGRGGGVGFGREGNRWGFGVERGDGEGVLVVPGEDWMEETVSCYRPG